MYTERELAVAQIATAVDTDGSICISVMNRGDMGYQFGTVVNIRQTARGQKLLEKAYDLFGGTFRPHVASMQTWQLSKHYDIKIALEEMLPYFMVKEKEAKLMLKAIDLLDNKNRIEPTRGRKGFPFSIKQQVLEISNSMNEGQQKASSRRNKEKRFEHLYLK